MTALDQLFSVSAAISCDLNNEKVSGVSWSDPLSRVRYGRPSLLLSSTRPHSSGETGEHRRRRAACGNTRHDLRLPCVCVCRTSSRLGVTSGCGQDSPLRICAFRYCLGQPFAYSCLFKTNNSFTQCLTFSCSFILT